MLILLLQVTEEAFCIVACRYARGEPILLPLEAESISELSPEQIKEFKQSNWIKKARLTGFLIILPYLLF